MHLFSDGICNLNSDLTIFNSVRIPALETKRLTLEPQSTDHVDELFIKFQDRELFHYMDREPLKDHEAFLAAIKKLKSRIIPKLSEYRFNWVLKDRKTEEIIGQMEVSQQINENIFYLAYTVFRDYWRQGFAKEACLEVLAYMRDQHNCTQCILEIDERNSASIALARSLGGKYQDSLDRKKKIKGKLTTELTYIIET